MKKTLIIVCCTLLCARCEDVTSAEVCPSGIKPINGALIKLEHTTEVDPGTICQCKAQTLLKEPAKCMTIRPRYDFKYKRLPSFVGGMDRDAEVQVAVSNDSCISHANLRFRADNVYGSSLDITGTSLQVQVLCKKLHKSANGWGSRCNVSGPSDGRRMSILCNRGGLSSTNGYISCAANGAIQVHNVLFGVNKDSNKCTRDLGDTFFNVHCFREIDPDIPNNFLINWNNTIREYGLYVHQIEKCNDKSHCAVSPMKNEARVSYVVVEYTCRLDHRIWPWVVCSCIFLVLSILVMYGLRRRHLTQASFRIMKERRQSNESTDQIRSQDNRNQPHSPHEHTSNYTYIETTGFHEEGLTITESANGNDGAYDHLRRGNEGHRTWEEGGSPCFGTNQSNIAYDHAFFVNGIDGSQVEVTSTYDHTRFNQNVMRVNEREGPSPGDDENVHTYHIIEENEQEKGRNTENARHATYDRVHDTGFRRDVNHDVTVTYVTHDAKVQYDVTNDAKIKNDDTNDIGISNDATRDSLSNNRYELATAFDSNGTTCFVQQAK